MSEILKAKNLKEFLAEKTCDNDDYIRLTVNRENKTITLLRHIREPKSKNPDMIHYSLEMDIPLGTLAINHPDPRKISEQKEVCFSLHSSDAYNVIGYLKQISTRKAIPKTYMDFYPLNNSDAADKLGIIAEHLTLTTLDHWASKGFCAPHGTVTVCIESWFKYQDNVSYVNSLVPEYR